MRIAIAGVGHETMNFSPISAGAEDFDVWREDEILAYPTIGDSVEQLQFEPVPILIANTRVPSGWVEEETYLDFRQEILAGLERAGTVDGVCLVLHGAMLVENIWSGETDLVRSIRALVGQDVLIAAMLDMHATLTEEFANKVDTWTGYRTAPHRDIDETLKRAFSLLTQSLRSGERPQPAFVRLPLLLQGEKATSRAEPMQGLLAMARQIQERPGILNAEVLVGNGWADSPHAGASVAVVAQDTEHLPLARCEAKRLAQAMWDARQAFTFDMEVCDSVDKAIQRALDAPEATVFLSDSGDNHTAGTPGDATYFLSRLLDMNVPDAVLASIPDAQAATACFEAGVGAEVRLSLGAKMDTIHGNPVEVAATVEHLYDPASREEPGPAGLREAAMVTVRVGGVRIVVTDLRKAFMVMEDFAKAGVDPLAHKIVVVKLGYLMPELRDAAPREILVLSPGYADMELTRLPYAYVTRPIFPLDRGFDWHPLISNVVGYGG
jgi:microcystin degradation protein MlrC